jgi:hypothetical protein
MIMAALPARGLGLRKGVMPAQPAQYRSAGADAILVRAVPHTMPATPHSPSVSDSGDHDMTRTYAWVLAVEALVILALWGFGRYFG